MAFITIAGGIILLALMFNGSAKTFVGNFLLGREWVMEFFLLSFQSFLQVFAVLGQQNKGIISKFVTVLTYKGFQCNNCDKG